MKISLNTLFNIGDTVYIRNGSEVIRAKVYRIIIHASHGSPLYTRYLCHYGRDSYGKDIEVTESSVFSTCEEAFDARQ